MTASITDQLFDLAGFSEAWKTEARDVHGEWVKTGTGVDRYAIPDHARLINPRGKPPDPADHPFFKKHPVSPANIVRVYDNTTPQERAQGMRWYSDVHLLADKMTDGEPGKGAILLSTYSPQVRWPINMLNAARAAEEGRALGPGDGMITRAQQANAQAALDGKPVDEVLTSPKTRVFGRLIELGGDHPGDPYGQVVVDRHALSVATGYTVPDKERDTAPIGDPRYHEYVGDQYRIAAQQISKRDGKLITPHQLQAITWLHQLTAREAADQAAAEAGVPTAKGRLAGTRNAWQRWLAYAQSQGLQLQPGTTALAGSLVAQVLEMIYGDSITAQLLLAFDPDELRDPHGRWTAGAGSTVHYTGSLGIDRAEMPQLSGTVRGEYRGSAEMQPKFIQHLQDRGISVTHERVPASQLRPTQSTGDMGVIGGIADNITGGHQTKPIFVSSDDRVMDGHHTWAAHLLAEQRTGNPAHGQMDVVRVGLPIDRLLDEAHAFGAAQGIERRATGQIANPEYAGPRMVHPDAGVRDTLSAYSSGGGGQVEPGRMALHRDIIEKILGGHASQQHPKAMFLGGGTASGKSSLIAASPEGLPEDAATIDPDAIKEMIPEYQQLRAAGDPRAASFAHEESSLISKLAIAQAHERKINYVLDGTGDSEYAKLAGKVSNARNAGFEVTSKYVTADTDTAVCRAQERARATGRMIPEPVIREIHAAVTDAYRRAADQELFDATELWDTNGSHPLLVASKVPGGHFTVHDPVAWQRFLDKGTDQG